MIKALISGPQCRSGHWRTGSSGHILRIPDQGSHRGTRSVREHAGLHVDPQCRSGYRKIIRKVSPDSARFERTRQQRCPVRLNLARARRCGQRLDKMARTDKCSRVRIYLAFSVGDGSGRSFITCVTCPVLPSAGRHRAYRGSAVHPTSLMISAATSATVRPSVAIRGTQGGVISSSWRATMSLRSNRRKVAFG
jgi:hypothetical protein